MKVRIDFSVFTSNGDAVGRINGNLDLAVVPVIGDTVSLMLSPNGMAICPGHEFGGQLKITDRVIVAGQQDPPIILMLSDLITETRKQALDLMEYFERGFGFFSTTY